MAQQKPQPLDFKTASDAVLKSNGKMAMRRVDEKHGKPTDPHATKYITANAGVLWRTTYGGVKDRKARFSKGIAAKWYLLPAESQTAENEDIGEL